MGILILRKTCVLLWLFPASQVSHRSKSTQLAHLYRNPRIGEVLHLLHVMPPIWDKSFSNYYITHLTSAFRSSLR